LHILTVIFIDASDQVRVGRAQNYLEAEHVNQIFDWYKAFGDVDNYVKVASLDNLKENDFNLNIPLYVEKSLKTIYPVWKKPWLI
jgi:type I restriction enzyme M protein